MVGQTLDDLFFKRGRLVVVAVDNLFNILLPILIQTFNRNICPLSKIGKILLYQTEYWSPNGYSRTSSDLQIFLEIAQTMFSILVLLLLFETMKNDVILVICIKVILFFLFFA